MALGTIPEDWTLGFSQGPREKRPEAPVTSDSMEIDQKANSSKKRFSGLCHLHACRAWGALLWKRKTRGG